MAIEFIVNPAATTVAQQASGGSQSGPQSAAGAGPVRQAAPVGGEQLPPKGGTDSPDSKQRVADALTHLNKHAQTLHRKMEFTVDNVTGRVVVKVVDSETHELIREIPQDEVLDIVRHLEEARGLLLKAKA